jgi:hypothetical protein
MAKFGLAASQSLCGWCWHHDGGTPPIAAVPFLQQVLSVNRRDPAYRIGCREHDPGIFHAAVDRL